MYFEDFMTYWEANLEGILPASQVYLARHTQDVADDVFAVVFPLASEEPLETTGTLQVETLPFEIHIHGKTSEVIDIGNDLWDELENAPINANTIGMIQKSRRYIRESSDLHHYIIQFDWVLS